MKILQNYTLQFTYRCILFLAGLLGVSIQLWRNGGANMLLYYTILSNILVTLFLGYLVYLMAKKSDRYQSNSFLRTKTGVTMAIMITFFIYHTMLRPYIFPEQFWRIENLLCHYILPLGFFTDGLLFDHKIRFSPFDPLYWTSFPLFYSALALFNGTVTKFAIPGSPDSPYPYFFLNLDTNGWSGVLISSLFIFIFYLIGGYLLIGLKMLLNLFQKKLNT